MTTAEAWAERERLAATLTLSPEATWYRLWFECSAWQYPIRGWFNQWANEWPLITGTIRYERILEQWYDEAREFLFASREEQAVQSLIAPAVPAAISSLA